MAEINTKVTVTHLLWKLYGPNETKITLAVHRWTFTVFTVVCICSKDLFSGFEKKRRKMFVFRCVGTEGREVSQVYTAEVAHQDGI